MSSPATIKCPDCEGLGSLWTGSIGIVARWDCPRCNGTGKIEITENDEEAG